MRLIAALMLALPLGLVAIAPAAAQSCGSIHPGATFDTQRNSCLAPRVSESTCQQTPGAIQWHQDRGYGADVCEFRVPSEPAPAGTGGGSSPGTSSSAPTVSPDNPSASRGSGGAPPTSSDNPFVSKGTGASSGTSADNPFAPRAPQASANNPFAPQPRAGQCVRYFTQMQDQMKQLAGTCAASTGMLTSIADLITSQGVKRSNGAIDLPRNTATEIFALLPLNDPRWSIRGGNAVPNCALPLKVTTQADAFTECTRVYWCGMKAASCGVDAAQTSTTANCPSISQQCLQTNPIPTGVEALQPPGTLDKTPPVRSDTPSANPFGSAGSGISGPSSSSGGGLRPGTSAK